MARYRRRTGGRATTFAIAYAAAKIKDIVDIIDMLKTFAQGDRACIVRFAPTS